MLSDLNLNIKIRYINIKKTEMNIKASLEFHSIYSKKKKENQFIIVSVMSVLNKYLTKNKTKLLFAGD